MMVDPVNGWLHDPIASYPLTYVIYSVWDKHKVHQRYPDLSDKQTGELEAHHALRSINRPRRTDTRRSHTLDNKDVMKISL